jgi:transposase
MLQRLLDGLVDMPAVVLGRRMDILAWNTAAVALFGDYAALDRAERNIAWITFLDETSRELYAATFGTGHCNARIAHETGLHLDTLRTWRGRFAHGGPTALVDRKRSGRPTRFAPVQVAEAKALACQLTAETGMPLSRWSCPELATELTARGITDSVSSSTVCRWLREDALKPWHYRSWIFIRDPDFRAKAQRVLHLYGRTFEGVALGENEYVLSSDEKTSVYARCRAILAA